MSERRTNIPPTNFLKRFLFFSLRSISRLTIQNGGNSNSSIELKASQHVNLPASPPIYLPQELPVPFDPVDTDWPYGTYFANSFLVAYEPGTSAARDFVPPASGGSHQWFSDGNLVYRDNRCLQAWFDHRKRLRNGSKWRCDQARAASRVPSWCQLLLNSSLSVGTVLQG